MSGAGGPAVVGALVGLAFLLATGRPGRRPGASAPLSPLPVADSGLRIRSTSSALLGDDRRTRRAPSAPLGADEDAVARRRAQWGVAPSAARGSRAPSTRWRRGGPRADPALLLELVAVALAAGAPVPTALAAVGTAWPGVTGAAVERAARALELGAPWEVAWAGSPPAARAVADALAPSWSTGASPVPLLRAAAGRARSARRAATRTAAGRLGVQLVVPLGLCFLPAFVLLGLVPVVVSLASGLFG